MTLILWHALAHSHLLSATHITTAPHLARFWYFIHGTMDEGSIDIQDISCYVFWYCQSLVTERGLTFYALHRNNKVKKKKFPRMRKTKRRTVTSHAPWAPPGLLSLHPHR